MGESYHEMRLVRCARQYLVQYYSETIAAKVYVAAGRLTAR
jgi:hypothetical protein